MVDPWTGPSRRSRPPTRMRSVWRRLQTPKPPRHVRVFIGHRHLLDEPVQAVRAGTGLLHGLVVGVERGLKAQGAAKWCRRSRASCAPVHACLASSKIPCRSCSLESRSRAVISSPRLSSPARARSRAVSRSRRRPDCDDPSNRSNRGHMQHVTHVGLDSSAVAASTAAAASSAF